MVAACLDCLRLGYPLASKQLQVGRRICLQFADGNDFLAELPVFSPLSQLAWFDDGHVNARIVIELFAFPARVMRFALLHHCLMNRFRMFYAICGVSFVLFGCAESLQAAPRTEAYVGQPFGVASVTIDVLRGEPLLPLSDERFTAIEANGRALYPVLKQQPVRKILRGLLGREAPRKVTLYYLFLGDMPFDLSPFTPHEQGVRVKPLRDAAGHRRLLLEWWQQYTKHYESLLKDRAYPPVAENFLIASLSRRLDLPMPKPRRGLLDRNEGQEDALSYLFVNEAHRLRIDREMLREEPVEQIEPTALPEPIEWAKKESKNNLDEEELENVRVESLASHVPAECFYLRFGSFTNYLWFRDLNKKWQGDLGNMILRRGIKRGASDRIQQQLSLRENALAKILGPQVIADAAIIGLDPYVEQSAAIGILFQAKNEILLAADMMRQRREALTKYDDAKEQTLEVAGQSVSLISTPDGQVRSYYVKHEGFHLVTTSRTLVERFLQAGQGDRSLASLPSFRRFRQQFPLERDDTIVAFVSEEFWKNLCSPHYVVENQRRLRSSRESLLLELARYTAQGEGKVGQSTEELIAADILPSRFGARIDGSELQPIEGGYLDSLRGARGFYVPISDMPKSEVTVKESATFQHFKEILHKGIGEFPPFAAAAHRTPGEAGAPETISVDILVQGSLRQKLGTVGALVGGPAKKQLQPVEGDLLAVEVVVDSPTPLGGDHTEHHLFGALRDFRSPLVIQGGAIRPGATPPELIRGYLGAWPTPGLLALLTSAEEAKGAEPQPIGAKMWQAKQEDFLLLSFKPDVIEQVLPQLALQPTERAGQLWVRLEDLTGTQMAENVNALGYMRTRETSAAGSRMMNSLANQLHLPRDQCRAVAERLVDGTFVCPLGGEYQLFAPERGLEIWISSALPAHNRFMLNEVPEDFRLPMLNWFRGLAGDLRLDEQALNVHLEIKMTEAALP